MKALKYHIEAIKKTLNLLSTGKYFIYFIPSIIICLIFFTVFGFVSAIFSVFSFIDDIPGVGKYIFGSITGIASIIGYIWNQLMIFSVLILCSPINSIVSGKVDKQLTSYETQGGCATFINEMFRMLWILIIVLSLEFGLLILIYFMGWIFPFGVFGPIISFAISSFFIGFAFYDYSLERHNVSVGSSLAFAFKNPVSMFITGILFNLLYLIPYLGISLGPIIITMMSTVVYVSLSKKLSIN